MTFQSTFEPLYAPYIEAGHLLREYGVATYKALTSDTAKDIYKTIWILLQATFYLSVLAGLYTIKIGQQFRAYYKAEWSKDVNGFIHWIATYPDRCLEPECALIDEPPTDDTTTTTDTATVALHTEPSVTVEDDKISATIERAPLAPETTAAAIPETLQAIVTSDRTTTTKLRKIATYYKISWRNTRGNGKHSTNSTIREALQTRCPEVLAAL